MPAQGQVKTPLDLAVEVEHRIEIESRLVSASVSQHPQVLTEKPPDIEMDVAAQARVNAPQKKKRRSGRMPNSRLRGDTQGSPKIRPRS
jgi:hypothetical protein